MEHKPKAVHAVHHPAKAKSHSDLPVAITSPVDVGRLIRELDTLEDALTQRHLRKSEKDELPKTSHLLGQLADLNKVDISKADGRKQLLALLNAVRDQAPVLHISFSADPSPAFTEKLMAWLRQEIHPHVLITIGLQPNIGAGCIVRSTNKQFDFSLRQEFISKRDVLREQLKAIRSKPAPEETKPHPISTDGGTEAVEYAA